MKIGAFALGSVLGASMLFFGDPARGRRRRALLVDWINHRTRMTAIAFERALRDIVHRARGIRAVVAHPGELDVPDVVLVERVRSKLGRYVSHSHAVTVQAPDGIVRLDGLVFTREVQPLVRAIKRMHGVRHVENRLEPHHESEDLKTLQGGRTRAGERLPEKIRWNPALRIAAGGAGVGLLALGVRAAMRA